MAWSEVQLHLEIHPETLDCRNDNGNDKVMVSKQSNQQPWSPLSKLTISTRLLASNLQSQDCIDFKVRMLVIIHPFWYLSPYSGIDVLVGGFLPRCACSSCYCRCLADTLGFDAVQDGRTLEKHEQLGNMRAAMERRVALLAFNFFILKRSH